jgi:hypothetical protein
MNTCSSPASIVETSNGGNGRQIRLQDLCHTHSQRTARWLAPRRIRRDPILLTDAEQQHATACNGERTHVVCDVVLVVRPLQLEVELLGLGKADELPHMSRRQRPEAAANQRSTAGIRTCIVVHGTESSTVGRTGWLGRRRQPNWRRGAVRSALTIGLASLICVSVLCCLTPARSRVRVTSVAEIIRS